MTRRSLVAALLLGGPIGKAWATAGHDWRYQDPWSDLVGRALAARWRSDSGTWVETTLRLEEASLRPVARDPRRPSHLRPAAVSLLFSRPAAEPQNSATCIVAHPRRGEVRLSVNRISRAGSPGRGIYEAILN